MATLTESEQKLAQQMYTTLTNRAGRNSERLRFAEAEERLQKIGVSIPESMTDLQVALNWPQKAVEVFASRQTPEFYSMRDQSSELFTDLEEVHADNNYSWLEPQAIESADLFGVSFIFTTLGDPAKGEPEVLIHPRTALRATCIVDPRTRRTIAAMEVVDRKHVNIYFPGVVHYSTRKGADWIPEESFDLPYQRVLCTPYVHDASLSKPMGRSRLTPTVLDLTMAGGRTLLRQEVSATFYQAPRLALLGADDAIFKDKDGNPVDPWSVLTGAVWAVPDISPDDDPDVPDTLRRAGFEQFSQMSMQPFSDQYRLIASAVSGATSIPLHYLGVVQDSNPTSAQAIEAMEVDLVNAVRAQNRSLSLGRREHAIDVLTALNGDLTEVARTTVRSLIPRWADPRTRSLAEQSNFVATQIGAGNFVPGTEATLRQLPLDQEDVRIISAEAAQAKGESNFAAYLANASDTPTTGQIESPEVVEPAPESEATSDADDALKSAQVMKAKLDALGSGVRAGATFESLAGLLELEGVEFSGAVPVSLRLQKEDTEELEEQ